jgi:hypothetical protein
LAALLYACDSRFWYRIGVVPDVILNALPVVANLVSPDLSTIFQSNDFCGAEARDADGDNQ